MGSYTKRLGHRRGRCGKPIRPWTQRKTAPLNDPNKKCAIFYGLSATYGQYDTWQLPLHPYYQVCPIMHEQSHPHELHLSQTVHQPASRDRSGSHRSEAAARDGGGCCGSEGGSASRTACALVDPPARRPSGGWPGRRGPRRGSGPLLGRRPWSLSIALTGKRCARTTFPVNDPVDETKRVDKS